MNTSYIKYNEDNLIIATDKENHNISTIEELLQKEKTLEKLQYDLKELKKNKEYIDFQAKQAKFSNYVSLISYITLSVLLHFLAPKLNIITIIICGLPIVLFAEIINIATNDTFIIRTKKIKQIEYEINIKNKEIKDLQNSFKNNINYKKSTSSITTKIKQTDKSNDDILLNNKIKKLTK